MDIGTIRTLYVTKQLSASDVGKITGNTVWQVLRFMKKNHIPRRAKHISQHLKYLQTPSSFTIPSNLKHQDKLLWISGLMLYSAEGGKADKSTVDLANSDTVIIQIFLKMLLNIYHVNSKRLRVFLYCYPNQNISSLIHYWSTTLSMSKEQFTKPYIRKDFDPSKTNRMPYGLIHIRYSDTRLLAQIKQDIGIISHELLCRDTQVVNESGL